MVRILITHPIQKIGLDLLKQKGYSVVVKRGKPTLSQKELVGLVKGKKYDGIITMLTNKIDGKVMDAAGKQLRVISNFAVGFDNINVGDAKKRNIVIANTPCPEVSDAVAEHTIALLFSLARNIVSSDSFVRAGKYRGWEPMLFVGSELLGKKLGLIGLGRIGKGVVERAQAMGMRVCYHDVKRDELFEKEQKVEYVQLESLLASSDCISLHVPLLSVTRHLINAKTLSKMKKGALLINTARGPIVDEAAVAKALSTKKLGGYATDVFEYEPKLTCDPKKYNLSKLPNTILTPHIASATHKVRDAMARMAAQNLIDVFEGRKPQGLVTSA